MRETQIRILDRDVSNPTFDRRRRYGVDALDVFKAGTVFQYYVPDQDSILGRRGMSSAFLKGGGYLSLQQSELLFDNSSPYTVVSFADMCLDHDVSCPDWAALEVLESLVAKGIVSLETIQPILQQIVRGDDETQV